MEMNKEVLRAALRKVRESYEGKTMPVGDQVLVVFNDCSIIYTMEKGNYLKIEVSMDKPIVLDGDLFE